MESVVAIFREVRDPRKSNARHDLGETLFIAFCAILCGAQSSVEIADWGAARAGFLKTVLTLKHGAPSHDTFSRVFRLIDPAELEAALARFLAGLRAELGAPRPGRVVAIDGKALRRGYETARAFMPPLMVNVHDAETRLCLAATRAPGGSEVAGALALLKALDLKGCIVTADALHCRADTAATVRAKKAHYAFGLKANQPLLLADAEALFAEHGGRAPTYETSERRHGRAERRRASVLSAAAIAEARGFPGLVALGRIAAERTTASGRTTTAVRYVALSKTLSPRRLLEVVRAHWGVENALHWPLDVVFHEDDARSRKDHAPENLAVIRRIAQNVLRAHPSPMSMRRKMRHADWSQDFFFELFAHMR
jgi:predicted transposase YbfD/YdcC